MFSHTLQIKIGNCRPCLH